MEKTARWRTLKLNVSFPGRDFTHTAIHKIFIRPALWQVLRRDARHPIAAHFNRQLRQGRRIKILPLSVAYALLLAFLFANAYSLVDHAIMWTLPLWLMLFSLLYCSVWIGRIVALLSRQARSGVLDEVSMIPPGQAFVFMVIGKVVLNEGDALAWLTLLRRYLAGAIFFSLFMALCIAAAQIDQIDPLELGALLASLVLVALLIPLEHGQSTIIACLTAITVCTRFNSQVDKASIAVVCFAILQISSYSLAIAIVALLDTAQLSVALALYIVIRELLVAALWLAVLRVINEDDFIPRLMEWREATR